MTTSEALDWMQANHPKHSASAQKEAWYYRHYDKPEEKRPQPDYLISVLPGFDGSSCQRFQGPSFEECIAKIQEATRPPIAGEPNNE